MKIPPIDPITGTGYLTLRQQCAEIKKFARKTGLGVIRVICGRGTASGWRYIEVEAKPTDQQRADIIRYASKNGLCGYYWPEDSDNCTQKLVFKKGSQVI